MTSEREILVWDIPTRAFHWLTAVLVLAAYLTWRLDWMDWHAICGDALLTLVIFRLLWGFFGSDTTRFASFIARPRAAVQHLAHLFRREPDHQISHNPAGGLMVLLLIAFLLGETLSGLYVDNDVVDRRPFDRTRGGAESPMRSPLCTGFSGMHCSPPSPCIS